MKDTFKYKNLEILKRAHCLSSEELMKKLNRQRDTYYRWQSKGKALKEFADHASDEYATKKEVSALSGKVDNLVTAGGEPNVLEGVKVNGTELDITDKKVDVVIQVNGTNAPIEGKKVNITVPKTTNELTNNSDFQTSTQVSTSIQQAIAATGHASFKKVDTLPDYSAAEENVLYLLKNTKTQHYDIYAKVDGSDKLELIDDTTVDLTEYSTTDDIEGMLNDYVKQDGNKQLSTEDYTTAEKNKLAGIEIASDEEVTAALNEVFGAK